MTGDKDFDQKMQDIEARVKALKMSETVLKQTKGNKSSEQNDHVNKDESTQRSARAGSEFLASVIAGGLLGYGIDWIFSTLPWGMLFFLTMGFVSAVFRANAVLKKNNEK